LTSTKEPIFSTSSILD